MYNAWIVSGIVVPLCVSKAVGYEACIKFSLSTHQCDDGYKCCHDNTRCCVDGLTVGEWVGISIGVFIVVAMVSVILAFVCKCRRHKVRPQLVLKVQQSGKMTLAGSSHNSTLDHVERSDLNSVVPCSSSSYTQAATRETTKPDDDMCTFAVP